jgi:hypothetical protein
VQDSRRDVLASIARHDVVVSEQIATALSLGRDQAEELLIALVSSGDLGRARAFPGAAALYWITEQGLGAIGSPLPAPTFALRRVRECLGATWAYLRAADGRFPLAKVSTGREMLVRDSSIAASQHPVGLRVGGLPADNDLGLHHPDVLLEFSRRWWAVQVWLGSRDRRQLSGLLTAYGSDARYAYVIFLVEEERVAREIVAVASSLGLSEMVSVNWMEFGI